MRIGKCGGPVEAQFIGSRPSRGWQASTSVLALALAGGLAMPAPAYADDWLGTTSNDWFTAGNWSAGVPGAGAAVVINTNAPNSAVLNGGTASVGNVTVSTTTDASLLVSGGGKLNSSNNGIVGDAYNFTGTATVTGAGSEWNSNGMFAVGLSGIGILTVSSQGTFSAADVILGNSLGSGGTATIDGTGSTLTSAGNLLVGLHGTGTLMVSNGGAVSSVTGLIGTQASSTSSATVTGAGSTWSNSGDITVGNSGAGTLSILNGGAVTDTTGTIGAMVGSTGIATVDGVGSTWTNTVGDLFVGLNGTGTLVVSNKGAASSVGGWVGYYAGSNGTATIDGTGSSWTSSSDLHVGRSGTGTLTVSNGGAVNSTDGTLGSNSSGNGTATIIGAGSTWSNSGDLTVGNSGIGTLTIASGGAVSNVHGYIGLDVGSVGTVTVDGIGTTWTSSSGLSIGARGTGALTIRSGGTVNSVGINSVGEVFGSAGSVVVDGAGSIWNGNGFISIGAVGAGKLTISNGGTVSDAQGTLGDLAGAVGTAIVTDTGSIWNSSGDFTVGNSGAGTLTIANGGAVGNVQSYVGLNAGSTGTVMVDGVGSTWTSSSGLSIGAGGTGKLIISNGGAVRDVQGTLGDQAGAVGMATVTGAGSKWTSSDVLYLGDDGEGTLTIADSGTVSAGVAVAIAAGPGSKGALNIGGAEGAAAMAAGILDTPVVEFGSGTGTLNFNHTGPAYQFNAKISGAGTVNQLAGTTVLTGNSSSYTGVTNVTGGRLLVNGTLGGTVLALSGGSLGGSGTLAGPVSIASGGTLLGVKGQALTMGSLALSSGSNVDVVLGTPGGAGLFSVTGNLTLDGTLNVSDAGGVGIGVYKIFTYGGVLTDSGLDVASSLIFIDSTVNYDPANVYLTVARNNITFASVGLTPNQIATGAGVESQGTGDPIYDAVLNLSRMQARYAFDQLSGEVHASAKGVMIEDSRFVRGAVLDRLRDAFDAAGATSAPVVTYVDGKPVAVVGTDGFALWGRGFGAWGRSNGDSNVATVKRDIGGFFMGADGVVGDTWRVGVLGGYSRSTFNVTDRSSSGASDNYHVGLYGGTNWGDVAFRTGTSYTWHDISTSRSVAFPGFGDSGLKGNYTAGTAQAFGELGYNINMGSARFEPFANLAYVSLNTDGFREMGGAAALTSGRSTTDATFTTLGLRASTSFDLNGATVTAKGTVGWRHAFGDTKPLSSMRLAGGGDTFTIGGVPISRDAAVIEAGLDYAITPAAALGVSYSGQFGSGLADQSLNVNFNVKF